MKYLFIALAMVLISVAASAQSTVGYGYDACGNRVLRQVVLKINNKSLSVSTQQTDFSEEQLGTVQVRISQTLLTDN